MYVTPTAAAWSKLNVSSLRRKLATGTTMYCAWLPSMVNPALPVPQTSAPSQASGLASTTPAKSRPGILGSVVCDIASAMFFTSLGLTDAATTLTRASPWPGIRSGTSTTSSTSGAPKRRMWLLSWGAPLSIYAPVIWWLPGGTLMADFAYLFFVSRTGINWRKE
jgi:hypothetical protein